MNSTARQVRSMTMVKLDAAVGAEHKITPELIHEWVFKIAELLDVQSTCATEDLGQLVRDLEAEYNVHVGSWSSLQDDGDHVKWLDERKLNTERWPFWERYERYLRDLQGLPPASIRSVNEITDDLLGRLEAPDRPGPWDRRGLVAGQVQSGKTANYTGLVSKALDSGYKLVVILAGVHNSLRSQTQARIDEGILGFDTRNHLRFDQTEESNLIGVGRIGGKFLHVNSFTSSKDKGDFSLPIARNIGVVVGGNDPIVLVVKKNKSILTNLYKWATALATETDESGKTVVRDVPVLVIDDEADHASVDTSGPKRGQDPEEVNPTVINGLIRKFLDTFEQTGYVAYTATPFANIFISPDKVHREVGQDLFPRSFIVNLPAPSTYIGPARVFGLQEDGAYSIEAVEPLPIVRPVNDYDDWLPDNHKSDLVLGGDLPASLREAILAFLIGGAVRALRGQGRKHNSMLVHVTRFTKVQAQVAQQVEQELMDMRDRLAYGEGSNPTLRDAAIEQFERDHKNTTDLLRDTLDVADLAEELPAFEVVWAEMRNVAERTRVHTVNGTAEDALQYVDHPDGLSVIAVGGDKLSRGLTLEGLSISYYLRASRMYDTLMQMGRWFGYRSGYLDVCRLFTTPHLVRWYAAITGATEELQAEFEAMAALGRTPEDFGLRVRQHPDGLLVTSPSKLRNSATVSISYSATITETVTFDKTHATKNWRALEQLLASVGDLDEHTPAMKVWRNVPPEHVLDLLDGYRADDAAIQAQPKAIADYIRARLADHELVSWTVALADVRGAENSASLGGVDFGLTKRTPLETTTTRVAFRRIGSPRHEIVDLVHGSERWETLLQRTVKAWEESSRRKKSAVSPSVPSGYSERHDRSAEYGLMLLYPIDPASAIVTDPESGEVLTEDTPLVGFAISFPASTKAEAIAYRVNKVFWNQEFAAFDQSEDEDTQ